MQAYSPDGVKLDRTGWRDQKISERHRVWGFNCPAVDLDFLMVEYNMGLPVGLIEYKHHRAQTPDMRHPTYRALIELASLSGLPFMIVFYWPDVWAFRVFPINSKAKQHFKAPYQDCSELEFVTTLYRIRYLAIGDDVVKKLNKKSVPVGEKV